VLHFHDTAHAVSGEGSTISTPSSPASSGVRAFAALTGLTSLGILVEAVLAGQFINKRGQHTWVDAHGMVANVVVVLALLTVIVAWRLNRSTRGPLLVGSAVLLVLLVIQTIIGHVISDGHHPALTVVHVPIALLVFGLTVWLSVQAAVISRAARLG
jgi:heme A synthase